jgi:hypothetical protein
VVTLLTQRDVDRLVDMTFLLDPAQVPDYDPWINACPRSEPDDHAIPHDPHDR